MLAVEVAVVGGVDEQGVVEVALGLQRVDHLLDTIVDRQQRLELAAVTPLDGGDLTLVERRQATHSGRLVGDVGLVEVGGGRQRLGGEGVRVARRWLRRPVAVGGWVGVRVRAGDVRRRVGEPEKERTRLRRPAVEEVDRLPGQHVLLEVTRSMAVAGQDAVVVQGVVVDLLVVWRHHVPLRPARRLQRLVPVLVQVLADHRRVVTGALQPYGQVVARVERFEAVEAAGGPEVGPHPVVVRVLPGEEGGTRGAAERVVDETVGEGHPLIADQRVDVLHHPHRLERLVVGLDHQHVGRLRRGRRLAHGRRMRSRAERQCGRRPQRGEYQDQQASPSRSGTPHPPAHPAAILTAG